MAYRPPHSRSKPVPVVVETSCLDTSGFPTLGRTTTTTAKDYKKLAWGEVVKESEAEKEARLIKESREAAKESFRQFCKIPEPKPQIQNDEYQEAQLAYRDYLDALRQEEENPLPEAVHQEDEWETRETKVVQAPKQQVMPQQESESEMSASEMKERMEFLKKRLRRNGILREDKEAFEKELRELQKVQQSDSD